MMAPPRNFSAIRYDGRDATERAILEHIGPVRTMQPGEWAVRFEGGTIRILTSAEYAELML